MTTYAYEGEEHYELQIIVPQTVYDWLCARAEAECERANQTDHLPEDVASAEVISAMEYFVDMAEADAVLSARLGIA